MRILESLFGAHLGRLQKALGRTAERHSLLAGNLAHVSTPGYKRRDMDFALSLREAEGKPVGLALRRTHPLHLDGSQAHDRPRRLDQPDEETRSIRVDGNSIDLEREVAALTETQLHYSALTLVSRRHFQELRDVIREGR